MEQSGKPTERDSDNKVDVSIQCDGIQNNQSREGQLEIELRIAREEIAELKQEKKQLKAHNTKKHSGYEAQYDEILLEKQRICGEMVKLQSENDLLHAKVTALENRVKGNEVDECIKNVRCEGDCEHMGCNRLQAQRLQEMKEQGGRRQSPGEQADFTVKIYCPQCNFTCRQKSELTEHVKMNHSHLPSCPFCLIGFFNQPSLRKHNEEYHNENTPIIRERPVSGRQERPSVKRGVCIFFLQPRGCKKGMNCDFSHEKSVQYSSFKVPKMCRNGPGCTWKPRCRYVHAEDGETIPPRTPRAGSGSTREGTRVEDFVQDLHQPPPGNNMANYPGLGQAQNPNMFRPWMGTETSQ